MIIRIFFNVLICFSFISKESQNPFIVVLGIAQDAGYPQVGCEKDCCKKYWDHQIPKQHVSCLALFDPVTKQKWIIDATPDFSEQFHEANKIQMGELSGIFLTHAHIGHYTGLMYLGREAMNAKEIPVYAMPRMCDYLEKNGPWNQLVNLKNIRLQKLKNDSTIKLTNTISVTPVLVPHRDEYSETVGYSIKAGKKSLLFIPDIDKWQKWDHDIKKQVQQHDYVIIDGSFYQEGELPGRNMAEIPHPFVTESMQLFKDLKADEKQKIWFIHFNHTNTLIDKRSNEFRRTKSAGYNIAFEGLKINL